MSVVGKFVRLIFDGSARPDDRSGALRRDPSVYLGLGLDVDTVLVKDPLKAEIRFPRWGARPDAICAEHSAPATGFAGHRLAALAVLPRPSSPAIAEIGANVSTCVTAGPRNRAFGAQGLGMWAMQLLADGFLNADPAMPDRLHPADRRNAHSEDSAEWKRESAARARAAPRAAAADFGDAASAHVFLLPDPLIDRVAIGRRPTPCLQNVVRAPACDSRDTGPEASA